MKKNFLIMMLTLMGFVAVASNRSGANIIGASYY